MADLTIALAGNPNAGKTTIFNALTGLHQHTGNWPGKTVEKKEGEIEHNGLGLGRDSNQKGWQGKRGCKQTRCDDRLNTLLLRRQGLT